MNESALIRIPENGNIVITGDVIGVNARLLEPGLRARDAKTNALYETFSKKRQDAINRDRDEKEFHRLRGLFDLSCKELRTAEGRQADLQSIVEKAVVQVGKATEEAQDELLAVDSEIARHKSTRLILARKTREASDKARQSRGEIKERCKSAEVSGSIARETVARESLMSGGASLTDVIVTVAAVRQLRERITRESWAEERPDFFDRELDQLIGPAEPPAQPSAPIAHNVGTASATHSAPQKPAAPSGYSPAPPRPKVTAADLPNHTKEVLQPAGT